MAKSLAAFFFQEAGQNINEEDYIMKDDTSTNSQSLHDDTSAVLAAEKAAKEMADAVSFTSSITADTALKSKKQPKQEKWYAYWSNEYQREYYYEPKSQKVTWTPPDSYSVTSSFQGNKTIDDNVSVASSHNSMPSVNTTSESRSVTPQQWSSRDFTPSVADSVRSGSTMTRSKSLRLRTVALRKSRKKRMIRRILWSTATAIVLASSCTYYAYNNGMLSQSQREYVEFVLDSIQDKIQFIPFLKKEPEMKAEIKHMKPQPTIKEKQNLKRNLNKKQNLQYS